MIPVPCQKGNPWTNLTVTSSGTTDMKHGSGGAAMTTNKSIENLLLENKHTGSQINHHKKHEKSRIVGKDVTSIETSGNSVTDIGAPSLLGKLHHGHKHGHHGHGHWHGHHGHHGCGGPWWGGDHEHSHYPAYWNQYHGAYSNASAKAKAHAWTAGGKSTAKAKAKAKAQSGTWGWGPNGGSYSQADAKAKAKSASWGSNGGSWESSHAHARSHARSHSHRHGHGHGPIFIGGAK